MSVLDPIDIDFGGKDLSSFDPDDDPPNYIQPGWYKAIITLVDKKHSYRDNDYLVWKMRPFNVHPDFRLNYVTVLGVEAALYRLQDLIEATTGIRPLGRIRFNPRALVGSELLIKVETDHYMHQIKNTVAEVKPIDTELGPLGAIR